MQARAPLATCRVAPRAAPRAARSSGACVLAVVGAAYLAAACCEVELVRIEAVAARRRMM